MFTNKPLSLDFLQARFVEQLNGRKLQIQHFVEIASSVFF